MTFDLVRARHYLSPRGCVRILGGISRFQIAKKERLVILKDIPGGRGIICHLSLNPSELRIAYGFTLVAVDLSYKYYPSASKQLCNRFQL